MQKFDEKDIKKEKIITGMLCHVEDKGYTMYSDCGCESFDMHEGGCFGLCPAKPGENWGSCALRCMDHNDCILPEEKCLYHKSIP